MPSSGHNLFEMFPFQNEVTVFGFSMYNKTCVVGIFPLWLQKCCIPWSFSQQPSEAADIPERARSSCFLTLPSLWCDDIQMASLIPTCVHCTLTSHRRALYHWEGAEPMLQEGKHIFRRLCRPMISWEHSQRTCDLLA